ncbi:MAG TPA: hypothetical protein VGK73_04265, partial [Polyangiaceae bacterium]
MTLGALAWCWGAAGCNANPVADIAIACRDDSECPSNEICKLRIGSMERPAFVRPTECPIDFPTCADDSMCPSGTLCFSSDHIPYVAKFISCELPPSVCLPPCPETSCWADEACEADGACRLTSCDEEGALACSALWVCDPPGAAGEPLGPALGGVEVDSPIAAREIRRGCVRLRCDEAGGFTCKDSWGCDPEDATDPSGCVPLPCSETGHCSDDSRICAPSSAGPRPAGLDVHGCAFRNCEEGVSCENVIAGVHVSHCDVGAPTANAYGCVTLPCDLSGGACWGKYVCDPGAAAADERGCRSPTCADGVTCPRDNICDPSAPAADALGCVAGAAGAADGSQMLS